MGGRRAEFGRRGGRTEAKAERVAAVARVLGEESTKESGPVVPNLEVEAAAREATLGGEAKATGRHWRPWGRGRIMYWEGCSDATE